MNNSNWQERFRQLFTEECKQDGKTYYDSPFGKYSDVWFGPKELESFIETLLEEERQGLVSKIKTLPNPGSWNDQSWQEAKQDITSALLSLLTKKE